MPRANTAERDRAIRRGLEFIYHTACDPYNFESYGHDYLCCFHCIASTSKDTDLSHMAWDMGQERARQWRSEHSEVPADADADTVACLVFGSSAADQLGVPDRRLNKQIKKIAGDFTARDYFW